MNKEIITTTKQMNALSSEAFFLEYFLTEEEVIPEGGIGLCSFGVEIVMWTGELTESMAVPSISCDKALVLELIESLSRNVVTPATVLDVVSDKLYEWENPLDTTPPCRERSHFWLIEIVGPVIAPVLFAALSPVSCARFYSTFHMWNTVWIFCNQSKKSLTRRAVTGIIFTVSVKMDIILRICIVVGYNPSHRCFSNRLREV